MSGGRLITNLSGATVGPADYSEKTNLRRDRDADQRREGYLKFSPLAAIANQFLFDPVLTCLKQVELVRGDGTKAIIGFSRSVVKVFNNTAGTWDTIGSGYSASGKRWQTVTINGTLVANNGIDLPIFWNIGDVAVTAMKELREVGISCVGRILENNGFLIIADLTEIRSDLLQAFMRGWSTYTVSATVAKVASFNILDADSTKEFDVTTGAANMVATLPAAPSSGFYVWVKKVDAGVGHVTTSPVIIDIAVNLAAINDKSLIWWDDVLARYCAVFFSGGVVPADAPYGVPPANIVDRFPWAVANGEYGRPTQWAPVFSVRMAAASATIVLPFPVSVFIANQTRVAVINGGPLGGTLGGQETSPDGILVTAVVGRTLTLETSTDALISYPRIVQILRWTDVSSLVGRYDLQGDNSEIISLATLRNWIVVCRTTGLYLGRYTGDPGAPFVFSPVYSGSNVPLWPDAIANVRGDYLLYPSRGNRMYAFNGTSWPELHPVTDDISSLFFTSTDQTSEVYAVENSITKEWWFCLPATTLCYDYAQESVSVMDQAFDAAAIVRKPGTTDVWFILAIGKTIYTYGLVFGLTPIKTYLRDGVAVQGTLLFGLWHGQALFYGNWGPGDQANEKLLKSLTPLFASQSPNAAVKIYLGGTHNPNAGITDLLVPPESLPTPNGRNYVTLAFQYIYFRPRITIVDTNDVDCRITGIILEAETVGASGVTRSVN